MDPSPLRSITTTLPSNQSLVSNSNMPVLNEHYTNDYTNRCSDEVKEAFSEFNITKRGTAENPSTGCTLTQRAQCVSTNVKDRFVARFVGNEVENNVLNATLFDRYAPNRWYVEELVKYVSVCDSGDRGEKVARYLLRRIADGNSIVMAKGFIVYHRLITATDVKIIKPVLEMQKKGEMDFHAITTECKKRVLGGPNCDGGAALPILEVYGAYLQAIASHILGITEMLGTNIFKEKVHNNGFLSRMEMDTGIVELVRQSTEVLMIIAMMPTVKSLFNLEITRVLYTALMVDALCLYGFDSKALEAGFINRKGTQTKAGLLKWLRAFQAYENVGHALNRFFDNISNFHVSLPIQIPKLIVPAEGTAAKIRVSLNLVLAQEGEIDVCVLDEALASAQHAAGLQAPYSSCEAKRTKSSKSLASSVSPSRNFSDSHGNTDTANSSEYTPSNSSTGNSAITGFHIPKDKSDYTMQREITTLLSEPNTLDSFRVDTTGGDPLSDTQKADEFQSRFVDDASGSRFVIFSEDLLGKGSYGTVFKAWDEDEGKHVACKQISRHRSRHAAANSTATNGTVDGVTASLRGEFDVLTKLQHENIVSVYAFQSEPTASRIFMEWVPGGSVQDIFKRTGKGLSIPVIRKYMTGALKGLAYVHERHIVHRDIKPGNMLVDSTGNIKITDFGTSKLLEEVAGDSASDSESSTSPSAAAGTKSIVGTIPYLAPENFQGFYGACSDVWAIGASAVHMYTGRVPWSEKKFTDAIQLIFMIGSAKPPNHTPSYTAGVQGLAAPSGDFLDFLNACFTFDREARPSAAELLQHSFIVNEVRTPLTQ